MMPGQTNQLSNEKKAIAELEDAVAERIFSLKDMSSLSESSGSRNTFVPMDEFCKTLFSKIHVEQQMDPSVSQMNAAQALALLGANGTKD